MIEGNEIYLRPMEISDVQFKVNWINDNDVRKSLIIFDYPISAIATEQWLRKVSTDSSRKDFIVCLKSNNTPIGFAGLKSIDYKNLKAESYMGIGAKEYWGKGYGFDIKKTILIYSFDYLRLNKIYSHHLSDNMPMININLKLGGQMEGTLRQDVFTNGGLKDRVIISVLKHEMVR
ncbi:GNAT family N-acetyltransferase [Rubrolithibacter danxiaensis]|uniref:GNAT family N-acetyltransferase n=1 Tax=Rubrolithibacter danxiaensis TaxID=3390805 RepID=UPI003BF8CBAD